MLRLRWLLPLAAGALALLLAHCSGGDDPVATDPLDGAAADSPPPGTDGAVDSGPSPSAFACDAGVGVFARCAGNPLYLAGHQRSDGNVEISIGDPDTFFDEDDQTWKMWWSTGVAKTFAEAEGSPIHIKYAESRDGLHWTVQEEPALESRRDALNWDDTKIETPSVIKVPSNPPERRYVMVYAGGNDADYPRSDAVPYTWYQIGIAFSPDGRKFTRLPAAESPYASKASGFRKVEGLLLVGRDAFPGTAEVGGGLVADPEIVRDGATYHLLFSSLATKTDRTQFLAYGMSQATSQDGLAFTMAAGNPTIPGGTQPSVVKVGSTYELYLVHDSPDDNLRIPTDFNPYFGPWKRTSTDLRTWSPRSAAQEITFDVNVPSERYGWVKAGDMAYRDGVHRYYYVALGAQDVPARFAAHLRWDSGIPTPEGGVEYGPDGGVVVPAVIGLHVAAKR